MHDLLVQSSKEEVLEAGVSLECWRMFSEQVLPAVNKQVLKDSLYLVHIITWVEMLCGVPHSLFHLT